MKKILFILIISLISFPAFTLAAILYLEPASGEYYQNDTFIVKVKIDTENECINAVDVGLEYSKDILEAIDFSRANSILNIWLKPPSISKEKGLISFTGGVPGGYCGRLIGDPGESNILGKIIFKAKEISEKQQVEIKFLDSSQVLLNDGFGTPAKVKTQEALFTILAEKSELPQNEWVRELSMDRVLPEPFEIEIRQDPIIFDGKYFIVFQTQDKQTGIDHYEIKEGEGDWNTTDSPYLLEDQNLQSIIKVKAVDKAGNERIAEYIPALKPLKPFPYWLIIPGVIGIGVIWWIITKQKRNQTRNRRETHV